MTGWYPLGTRGGLLALRRAVFTPDGLLLDGRPLPWDAVGGGPLHTQAVGGARKGQSDSANG